MKKDVLRLCMYNTTSLITRLTDPYIQPTQEKRGNLVYTPSRSWVTSNRTVSRPLKQCSVHGLIKLMMIGYHPKINCNPTQWLFRGTSKIAPDMPSFDITMADLFTITMKDHSLPHSSLLLCEKWLGFEKFFDNYTTCRSSWFIEIHLGWYM